MYAVDLYYRAEGWKNFPMKKGKMLAVFVCRQWMLFPGFLNCKNIMTVQGQKNTTFLHICLNILHLQAKL